MTYNEWRDELKSNLLSVPDAERRKVLDYYAEAYADRREAGFSEREIIEDFGAPYDAAQRILAENKGEEYFEEPQKSGNEHPRQDNKAEKDKRVDLPAPSQKNGSTSTPAYANNAPTKAKTGYVKWVILSAVLIGVGIIIIFTMVAVKFLFITKPTFEMVTYTSQDENTLLDIHIGAGEVKTEFYDGDKIVIDYPASSAFKSKISENDGIFSYSSTPRRALFWGTWDIPQTTIKLPKDNIYNLDFEVDAGTVDIASGVYGIVKIELNAGTLKSDNLTCTILNCEVNAGSCYLKKLSCPEIQAEVNAGTLSIDIDDFRASYDIKAEVNAGSCNVGNQTVEGGKKLRISCSAGSVKVSFKD